MPYQSTRGTGANVDALLGKAGTALQPGDNLASIADPAQARTNLGLGTSAVEDIAAFATAAQGTKADTAHGWGDHALAGYLLPSSVDSLAKLNALVLDATVVSQADLSPVATSGAYSDLSGAPTLGTAASKDVGTVAGTVAAGDDARFALASSALQPSGNLGSLTDPAQARTNLGLGTAALSAASAFATSSQGDLADGALQAQSNLSDIVDAALARTNLGLGTAATSAAGDFDAAGTASDLLASHNTTYDHTKIATAVQSSQLGTGPNDVVQLDGSARLPAIDGSQLTNLPSGVTTHDQLDGLADDDHTQYHTDARGDARYYQKSEVDTALSGKADTSHNHDTDYAALGHNHDSRYYTETEVDNLLSAKSDSTHDHAGTYEPADSTILKDADIGSTVAAESHTHAGTDITPGNLHAEYTLTDGTSLDHHLTGIDQALSQKSDDTHLHDDRYYTETEVDDLLDGKASTGHTHDDRYYTETEVDGLLDDKASAGHTHDDRYYTQAQVNTLLDEKSDTDHLHAGVYEPVDSTILRASDIGTEVAAASHNHGTVYAPFSHSHSQYLEIADRRGFARCRARSSTPGNLTLNSGDAVGWYPYTSSGGAEYYSNTGSYYNGVRPLQINKSGWYFIFFQFYPVQLAARGLTGGQNVHIRNIQNNGAVAYAMVPKTGENTETPVQSGRATYLPAGAQLVLYNNTNIQLTFWNGEPVTELSIHYLGVA